MHPVKGPDGRLYLNLSEVAALIEARTVRGITRREQAYWADVLRAFEQQAIEQMRPMHVPEPEIQRTSQPSSLIDAARELLVDIDAFDKGGAFKKLRSYQRVRELTDYVPVGMGQIDRTGTLGSPCAKCDPERWKDCDLFGCDRVRAE